MKQPTHDKGKPPQHTIHMQVTHSRRANGPTTTARRASSKQRQPYTTGQRTVNKRKTTSKGNCVCSPGTKALTTAQNNATM